MNSKTLSFIRLFIGFTLSVIFIYTIPENFYPDYDTWKNKFFVVGPLDYQLLYIPQNLIIKFFNSNFLTSFFEIKQTYKLSDYSRFIFFIITYVTLIIIYLYLELIFRENIFHRNQQKLLLSTIIFPSAILGITASTPEAIYTILSLLIISKINIKNITAIKNLSLLPILIYAMIIDEGNCIILISFIAFVFLLYKINLNTKFVYTFVFVLSFTFIAFFIGKYLLLSIGDFFSIRKIADLYRNINEINLNSLEFFDLFKRYLYFWLTLLTLCSANSEPILTYSSFISLPLFIIIYYFKVEIIKISDLKFFFEDKYNQAILLSLIFFPIIIIILLPTHANGKYYIFFIYFILQFFYKIVPRKSLFILILIYTSVSIFEQFLRYNI